MIALTLALAPSAALGQTIQSVTLACPPNTSTTTVSAAPNTKFTCQVKITPSGTVSLLRLALALPAVPLTPLATAANFPQGLVNGVTGGLLSPPSADWRYGDINFAVSPTTTSGYTAGSWDAASREFRWGPLTISSVTELQVDITTPGGAPAGTYTATLNTTINAVAQPTLTKTFGFVVPVAAPPANAMVAQATGVTVVGGTFVFNSRLGGSLGSFTSSGWNPQTNASIVMRLPYWDPASASVKTDATTLAFSTASGHVSLIDFDKLEAKLDPNEGTKVEYYKPTTSDTGPVASGFNDGKLFVVDRTKNTLTFNVGAVAFPYVKNWYAVMRAGMKVPPSVTLAGRSASVTACLVSDQTPASAFRCASSSTSLVATLPAPTVTFDHRYNGNTSSCESAQAYPPRAGGTTFVAFSNNSGETIQNFSITFQIPGAASRNTVLGSALPPSGDPSILLGSSQAGNVDTDVWSSWVVGLSTGTSDYSNLANLGLRTLQTSGFTPCTRALPYQCRKTDTDASGIVLKDVTEVRLSTPAWEPRAWRHAKSPTNGDQLQLSWFPDTNAPTNTFDSGACTVTNCTGGAYCSAGVLKATGLTDIRFSAVSDVNGATVPVSASGTHLDPNLTQAVGASGPSPNPQIGTGLAAFIIKLQNTGYASGLLGPFEVETSLPENTQLSWKDAPVPSDRTPYVETYSAAGAGQWAKPANVVVTSAPLNDGTGRTRVKVVVNAIESPAGVAQVTAGRPYLAGPTGPGGNTATTQLIFNFRLLFLPGVATRVFNEDTILRYYVDNGSGPVLNEVPFNNVAATKTYINVASGNAVPKIDLGAFSAGGQTADPLEITPGSTFTLDAAFSNPGFLPNGDVDAAGAKGTATNSVLYQRVPRAADYPTNAPLTPVFVEAHGLKRPEFAANDLTEIWVTTQDFAPTALNVANSTSLQPAGGWARCTNTPDSSGNLACTASQASAALSGATPRWVAFVIGQARITDASPRGVPPINGATRIDRPYVGTITLRDAGSPRTGIFTVGSVGACSEWPGGLSPSANRTITIANGLPVWTAVPAKTVAENGTLTFTVAASDPNDSDVLTFAADAATVPTGATFDPVTRVFRWTPDNEQAGHYDVRITTTDGLATVPLVVSIDVTNVNRAPVLAAANHDTFVDDDLVFTATTSDPDRQAVVVTCADLPSGMTYDDATRTFRWKPTAANVGVHTLHLVATDPEGATATKTIVVTVNGAPSFTAVPPQNVRETDPLTFTIAASDPENDPLTFSVDPATQPRGATFNTTTGAFAWTPDYDQAGHYDVTFITRDAVNFPQRLTVGIDVENVNRPPTLVVADQRVIEGRELTFTVSASDGDGEAVTVTVDDLPKGMTYDDANRRFHWTTAHGMLGVYRLHPVAHDPVGGTDPREITVVVARDGRPPTLDPVPDHVVYEGRPLAFELVAHDPDNDPLVCSVDPATLRDGMAFEPDTCLFTWTPGPDDHGDHLVTFVAEDQDGAARVSTHVFVVDVNRPPVLDPPAPAEGDEGSPLQVTLTGSDPDDDVVSFDADDLPAGATLDHATGVLTWTPTGSQSGSYVVHVVIVDAHGDIATGVLEITVNDLDSPPELAAIAPQSIEEGKPFNAFIVGSDADGDPIQFACTNLPTGARFDAPARRFYWIPDYGAAGLYDIVFTATSRGRTVNTTLQLTVVHVNRPVQVGTVAKKSVEVEKTLEFTISTEDPDHDAIVCEAKVLPDGARFDPPTLTFRWTPDLMQAGPWEARFSCADGVSFAETTVEIEVTERPYRRAGGGLASALGCSSTSLPGFLSLVALALALARRRRSV